MLSFTKLDSIIIEKLSLALELKNAVLFFALLDNKKLWIANLSISSTVILSWDSFWLSNCKFAPIPLTSPLWLKYSCAAGRENSFK